MSVDEVQAVQNDPATRGIWMNPKLTPGVMRSPCPGLNTLANHGYINRDGKAVPFIQLVKALQEVYNLSLPHSLILALGCYFKVGNGLHLDLHNMARHNAIEHDFSLAHRDAAPGAAFAPTDVDPAMLDAFLAHSADGTHVTVADLAAARVAREGASRLPSFFEFLARSEVLVMIEVFGKEVGAGLRAARIEDIRTWIGEERLPTGYTKPEKQVGLLAHLYDHLEINRDMDEQRKKEAERQKTR